MCAIGKAYLNKSEKIGVEELKGQYEVCFQWLHVHKNGHQSWTTVSKDILKDTIRHGCGNNVTVNLVNVCGNNFKNKTNHTRTLCE
jgi:hypothetical protein